MTNNDLRLLFKRDHGRNADTLYDTTSNVVIGEVIEDELDTLKEMAYNIEEAISSHSNKEAITNLIIKLQKELNALERLNVDISDIVEVEVYNLLYVQWLEEKLIEHMDIKDKLFR